MKKGYFKSLRPFAIGMAVVTSTITFAYSLPHVRLNVSAEETTLQKQYGLEDDVQDGVILHAFDWSFNNIKSQMANIAAAGYSAIQTSPIQPYKQASDSGNSTNATWWLFYQPLDFDITESSSENLLGSEAEFKSMCDEADKYGIKIIVDVVANHVAATRNGSASGYDYTIADRLKRTDFFHDMNFYGINYGNRSSIINNSMGSYPNTLPDLNTENTTLQGYVLSFLEDCIDDGADGFRFDAAKHIGVSADGSNYTFFPNVINTAKTYYANKSGTTADELYCYGEILDSPGGSITASNYISYVNVTDNGTSATIRNGVNGNAYNAVTTTYQKGVNAKNLVLWAESHDEYENESGSTRNTDYSYIEKAWAMDASRAGATSLYFARTNGYRAGNIGEIGTYNWKDAVVTAVNKFHNTFTDTSEYLSYNNNIAYNERGTSGVVIVNCSGTSQSVSLTAHKMASGTYKDQITGNTFTVSNGVISGNIGSSGIAVVYNTNAGAGTDTSSSTDTSIAHTVYLKLPSGWSTPVYCYAYSADETKSNAAWPGLAMSYDNTTGYYKYTVASSYAYVIFTDGTNQYPAAKQTGLSFSSANANWLYNNGTWASYAGSSSGSSSSSASSSAGTGETTADTYTVYFKNTSGWSNPYAYVWNDQASSVMVKTSWPGDAMTLVDSANQIYSLKIDAAKNYNHIIFSNKGSNQTADLTLTKGSYVYNYSASSWSTYTTGSSSDTNTSYTVYFKNTSGWSAPYAYVWNASVSPVTYEKSWPGVALTLVDSTNQIYSLTLEKADAYDHIIFSNNGSSQTADLSLTEGSYIYNLSTGSWSSYSAN